jgi:peroxiredoxin
MAVTSALCRASVDANLTTQFIVLRAALPLLRCNADEDRSVTKSYGLYHALGHDAFRIAHPATLIVDRSGRVRYIYRGENQADLAPLEEVLDALRKIRQHDSPLPARRECSS